MKFKLATTLALAALLPASAYAAQPIEPIRTAKAKVVVMKSTFAKVGNDYKKSTQVVCSKNVDIPVYEGVSTNHDEIGSPMIVTCSGKIGSEPVETRTALAIFQMLNNGSQTEPLNREFPELLGKTLKMPFAYFLVTSARNAAKVQNPISLAMGSLDLGLRSIFLELAPQVEMSCSNPTPAGPSVAAAAPSCVPSLMESFESIVHIED